MCSITCSSHCAFGRKPKTQENERVWQEFTGKARFGSSRLGGLVTAGLIGVAEVAPAGAAVVDDQPLSAVGSPMWQTNNTVWALDVANGVVYAGGQFTSVRPPGSALGTGEVARNRIAAFNATPVP